MRPLRHLCSGLAHSLGALAAMLFVIPVMGQVPRPETAEDLAAKALVRNALADFKLARPPLERDYRIAADLLDIAHRFALEDQIILRLLIEAATGANQPERVLALTRKLIALDPADTVSQLRFITGKISTLQSVDERLGAYERYLGEEGSPIDPSIRSRLALDSALLMRERGDLDAFAERLTMAVELDSTNKDAAALALAFFSERVQDPTGRLDLLLNVLYADPFDPSVHLALARHLAVNGAYRGAERFLATLARLEQSLRQRPDADEQAFRDAMDWNVRGAEVLIRRLTDRLDDDRKDVNRRRQALIAAKEPIDDVPLPEDIRLPFGSERTRLLAATAAGHREVAESSMSELAETASRMARQLADPELRPRDIPEEEVRPRVQQILGEVVWLRLWAGLQLDEAVSGLAVLKRGMDVEPAYLDRLDAWILLRRGELDAAETALRTLAPTDPHAELGLAVLAEKRNDRRTAATIYATLARVFGADLLGAFARTRVAAIAGAELPRTELSDRLENIASGVPDWLESMLDSPRRVVAVEADPEKTDVRLLDRTPLRITVTNVSPIPLAVGPDKPISSRFLLAPVAEVLAQPTASTDLVEVVSLDRRLRLLQRDQFDATVWADAGQLGLLLDMSATGNARVRWRVIQGFEFTASRIYDTGPHSVSTDTSMLVRRPSARFVADPSSLLASMETGGPRELGETILTMRARQARTTDVTPLSPAEILRMMDTLGARFTRLDKGTKILVLCLLPPPLVQPESASVDAIARRDADRDVLAATMVLRVTNPDDPIFALPGVQSDERLRQLADLVQERLRTPAKTYSTQETDVKPTIPPLIGPPRPPAQSK